MSDFSSIKMVSQPDNMKVELYPHQLASIFNMERLESGNPIHTTSSKFKSTVLGVQADETGYGKTLSMLGLIIRDKMDWDLDIPYVHEKIKIHAEGLVKNYEVLRFNKLPTTLVLMSQSLIGQWENELNRTSLKYISIKKKQDLTDLQAEEYDAVLVVPTMYNKLVTLYCNCAWKRFIFDEPGNLKVPGMMEVRAGFYWFLTATPTQIFFHHYKCGKGTFMRDIVGTSFTDFEIIFKGIIIQNSVEFIKSSFEMPKTFHHYHRCYQPIFNVISSFVNDNIKILIESGNIEDAIIALGGDKTSNIVELIKNKKEKEIEELDMRITLYKTREDKNKVTELEIRKDRLELQIQELEVKFKEMLKSPCNICTEELKSPVLEINCQNLFCGECLLTWLQRKSTCPLCRVNVDSKKLVYLDIKVEDKDMKETKNNKPALPSTKVEKIVQLIKDKNNGKFLIFSDHDKTFFSISSVLTENDISFVQLRGNIKKIEKNLDSFKNHDVQVIFLNSKYNGAGLNLQESTDIILYHEMNFDSETQIIGRANRIGRTIPLHIHHLQVSKL